MLQQSSWVRVVQAFSSYWCLKLLSRILEPGCLQHWLPPPAVCFVSCNDKISHHWSTCAHEQGASVAASACLSLQNPWKKITIKDVGIYFMVLIVQQLLDSIWHHLKCTQSKLLFVLSTDCLHKPWEKFVWAVCVQYDLDKNTCLIKNAISFMRAIKYAKSISLEVSGQTNWPGC